MRKTWLVSSFVGFLLLFSAIPGIAQEVHLSDNFEKRAADGWDLEPGWLVEQEGGNYLLSGEGHNWARLQRGEGWTNYSFRLRLKLIRGAIHLNYRVSEKGRYFIGLREEGLYLNKEAPWGEFADLAGSDTRIDFKVWHDIEIVGKDGHLQVYVDGILEIDFTDVAPLTYGSIAFETLDESRAMVDDVRVSSVPVRVVDLDWNDLVALREGGLQLVVGDYAQELFSAADNAFHKASFQAGQRDAGEAQRFIREAEATYREAILIGLREGLFSEAKRRLEEGESGVTRDNLTHAEQLYNQAQRPGIGAKDFSELVDKIKFVLVSGSSSPDLTVELYNVPYSQIKGINPSPPLTDRPTQVSFLVKNVGYAPVDKSFSIELYVDGDLKTWRFTPVSEEEDPLHAKNPLRPGGTRVYTYNEVSFTEPGKHTLLWVVDAKKEIKEGDESNNKLKVTATWQNPPDLIVEKVWPVGGQDGGQKSTWKIKVKNDGKGDVSSPFLTTFKPEVPGGSQENFWTQSLAAGKHVTFTSTQFFQAWGKRTLRATVDAGNFVPEALPNGEKNNEKVVQVDLSPVDLDVKNLIVNQKNCATTFAFTVSNNGPGNARQPFRAKFWPGKTGGAKVIWPKWAQKWSTPLYTEPVFLDIKKLQAGDSVQFKYTASLPAGDYPVTIEVDPDGVYFEPKSNNNMLVKNVHLKETYYIKIAQATYTSQCKDRLSVALDRSGGYYKGHVIVRLMYKGKVISECSYPPHAHICNVCWLKGYDIDPNPGQDWIAHASIVAYAGVGNQIIKSSAPETKIDIHLHRKPELTSISPSTAQREAKTSIYITGKNLIGPNNLCELKVWNFWPKEGSKSEGWLTTDMQTKIKITQASSSAIHAELDIPSNAKLGKRYVDVTHCGASNRLSFEVKAVTPPPKPPKPAISEVTVWLDKQPTLGAKKIPYYGTITPVPNGVLQTITNVNTSLGNQWGVRIIKAGYTTDNCDKAKAVIDLAPGKSTDYFKGASLSKGYGITACIYPVSVASATAPNKVGVKVTFKK
jgi:hypothetical protein